MVICQFKCLAGLAKVKRGTFSRKIARISIPQICEQVSLSRIFMSLPFLYLLKYFGPNLWPQSGQMLSVLTGQKRVTPCNCPHKDFFVKEEMVGTGVV